MSKSLAISKPMMAVNVPGFDTHYFYYGQGMKKNWIKTNNSFLDLVGIKYESECHPLTACHVAQLQ